MIILFRNIPKDSYHNDINDIIQPVIKGGLFRERGDIKSIEIVALKDINTQLFEFQALAKVEPEAVAVRVIKRLHGIYIKGCRIMVREYIIRNWQNDKRHAETNVDWQNQERRTNPCRRRKLKVYKIALPEYR